MNRSENEKNVEKNVQWRFSGSVENQKFITLS